MYNHEIALDVGLKLKAAGPSPLHAGGEKTCSFAFEIIEQ